MKIGNFRHFLHIVYLICYAFTAISVLALVDFHRARIWLCGSFITLIISLIFVKYLNRYKPFPINNDESIPKFFLKIVVTTILIPIGLSIYVVFSLLFDSQLIGDCGWAMITLSGYVGAAVADSEPQK